MKTNILFYSILLSFSFLFVACDKDSDDDVTATCSDGVQNGNETGIDCGGSDCQPCAVVGAPIVRTQQVSSIEGYSAIAYGHVQSEGDAPVTVRGFAYSTSPNPTIDGQTRENDNGGPGNYANTLWSLSDGTTYYVRAFATNSIGTSYGDELSFTTVVIPPVIVVSAWIDPGNGKLYAVASNGKIRSKTNYTNSWSTVDDDEFDGLNLRTAWIDPGDGKLYAAGSDGNIRKKNTYTSSWSYVDDASYSGNNLESTWIDPGNGKLYGVGSDGEMRSKSSYTSSWSYVDDATFNGEKVTTAWIDPGDGKLYAADVDGNIRKKSTYTGSWSYVDDSNYSGNNLQSTWIDPSNGKLYGIAEDGKLRSKSSYTGSWSYVDDSTF